MIYTVTIKPKRAAWNDRGERFTIAAANKRDAIREGRRLAKLHCSYDRTDGALICTAEAEA